MQFMMFTKPFEFTTLESAMKCFSKIIQGLVAKKIKVRLCKCDEKYFLEREVGENETVVLNDFSQKKMVDSEWMKNKYRNRIVIREF